MPSKKAKKKRGIIFSLTKKDCKWLKKITLMSGAGGKDDEANHRVCVMQAVSALTTKEQIGVGRLSDTPICVSEEITDYMIGLNDSIFSDRTRGRLKSLIPHILNTAPVIWSNNPHWVYLPGGKGHYETQEIQTRDEDNKKYQVAERKRREVLKRVPVEDEDISLRTKLEAVRRAADLFRTGTSEVCDS